MTTDGKQRATSWFEQEQRKFRDAASILQAGQEQFDVAMARVSAHVQRLAQSVETKQAVLELRPRPIVDLDASLLTLAREGPQALSAREARALVSHPDRVPARDAERILNRSPQLLRHLLRAVLSNWYQYCEEAWGADYYQLLWTRSGGSGLPLLENTTIGASSALSRMDTSGAARLGASLPQQDVAELHRHLREELGLRDSWLYTGQVLAWWLTAQVERGRQLDGALGEIRINPRLRALLLPSLAANTNTAAGVRIDAMVHARSVAAFLRAAFDTRPLLNRTTPSSVGRMRTRAIDAQVLI